MIKRKEEDWKEIFFLGFALIRRSLQAIASLASDMSLLVGGAGGLNFVNKYFNISDWIAMVVGSSAEELNALHGGASLPPHHHSPSAVQ